ncbi:fucose permease [Brachybacterium muris]|uniref:MFS transporter n=1 Tax=Brachybacterium muris UCD-AY4 TaxID=1249481 RepID=A0A022KZ24_9MICO|nr:MFS transporter [Brachybacterium muris]EYT49914.1 MFS transporter [Brachybacterium muris UCD-AY4]MBM7500179.1 fucose permease [Brachybacterium muris]MCT1431220.1 MFS transporter [Brachybacterium muris]MCT1655330.1 MFS transporter [Brachybacterium muris]MCT2177575.1 MFS transporter [Brachybacterium muris]
MNVPTPPPGDTRSSIPTDARRARWAVSMIFFLNGLSFCAILPRYPELVESIGLSNTAFGLAVGLGPVGGLLAGLGAAGLMSRWGTARVAVTAQIAATTSHLLVYVSGSWLWLAGSLLLAAACDAITDIAMNGHGMRVERRYRRSIMNSYHGYWSLGAVTGGVLGAAGAQVGLPLWIQGVAGLVLFGAAAMVAGRFMLPGPDSTERTPVAGPSPASAADVPADAAPEGSSGIRIAGMSLRALGLIAALGMVLVFAGSSEDAGNTWGALFMNSTFEVTPFVAGLAFVALQGAQTIGRFTGDAVVDRLGDRLTARIGALIAAVGMSFAMLVPTPVTALIGFAAVGWGIATLFPAAFRAADDMPGVPQGVGITVVGWLARVGFFVTPPLIGALADAFTLRYALWMVPLYAVGILVFSGVLSGRDDTSADQDR